MREFRVVKRYRLIDPYLVQSRQDSWDFWWSDKWFQTLRGAKRYIARQQMEVQPPNVVYQTGGMKHE